MLFTQRTSLKESPKMWVRVVVVSEEENNGTKEDMMRLLLSIILNYFTIHRNSNDLIL